MPCKATFINNGLITPPTQWITRRTAGELGRLVGCARIGFVLPGFHRWVAGLGRVS
jgi:hypothetical protein